MYYEISIRITFPPETTDVLRKEKQRFTSQYGSKYKSEPHITVYLDSSTVEGYSKLLDKLWSLHIEPFTISLIAPKIRREENRRRNLYIMDISPKEALHKLHETIAKIAMPYKTQSVREKEKFDPHITLGEIGFDKPQADIADSEKNLKSIEGRKITVSQMTVFFYGKEDGAEKMKLLQEVAIPFPI